MQKNSNYKYASNFTVLPIWFCFASRNKGYHPYHPDCPGTGYMAQASLKSPTCLSWDYRCVPPWTPWKDFLRRHEQTIRGDIQCHVHFPPNLFYTISIKISVCCQSASQRETNSVLGWGRVKEVSTTFLLMPYREVERRYKDMYLQ